MRAGPDIQSLAMMIFSCVLGHDGLLSSGIRTGTLWTVLTPSYRCLSRTRLSLPWTQFLCCCSGPFGSSGPSEDPNKDLD
jgi:hypothetical protein